MFKTKSTGDLVQAFKAHAINHGRGMRSGNYKLTNRSYENIEEILRELFKRSAQDQLAGLLRHSDTSVRCCAGVALLTVDEETAIAALERVVAEDSGAVGYDAKMVLEGWRKGERDFPWLP